MDVRKGASAAVIAAFMLMNTATSKSKTDSSPTESTAVAQPTPTTPPQVVATPTPPTPPTSTKIDGLSGLPAGVTADETQTEYDVSGTTAAALAAEMNTKGPRLPNGTVLKHYTEWNIEWKFDRTKMGATCKLSNPRVTLKDKIIMPRWIAPAGASPELVAKWDAFRKAAATHEATHRGIAAGAAASIALAIPQTSAPNCAAAEANANANAKMMIANALEAEKQPDAKTHHGEVEGAVFP
jgi:predicted secreted Zn-dependent protease